MSSSLEVFDLDTGDHLGRVVDLHEEGLMLLSNRPVDLNRAFSLQVNLPMTLNGVNEFLLDAESLWNRVSIIELSSKRCETKDERNERGQ